MEGYSPQSFQTVQEEFMWFIFHGEGFQPLKTMEYMAPTHPIKLILNTMLKWHMAHYFISFAYRYSIAVSWVSVKLLRNQCFKKSVKLLRKQGIYQLQVRVWFLEIAFILTSVCVCVVCVCVCVSKCVFCVFVCPLPRQIITDQVKYVKMK